MGMFDGHSSTPFGDTFAIGQSFVLQSARLVPNVETEFGRGTMAVLTIDGADYSLFGRGVVSQIEQQDETDLPAKVKIALRPAKPGRSPMKIIVPDRVQLTSDGFVIDDAMPF